jgi:hypothetical protein
MKILPAIATVSLLFAQPSTGQTKSADFGNAGEFPDNCEVASRSFPTALQYYGKFHPADTVFDFFCKVQLLNGTGELRIEFNDDGRGYTGSFRRPFTFDGSAKLSKSDTAKMLIDAMQSHLSVKGPARQQLRPLSNYGLPTETPEGKRTFYNTAVKISFNGLDIMGAKFSVIAFYETTTGAIVSWARGTERQLEFPMMDVTRSNTPRPTGLQVHVPLAFKAMMLYSDDQAALRHVKDDVKRAISDKYAKFAEKPGIYTDKTNAIVVEEGSVDKAGRLCGPPRQVPVPGGGVEMQPPLGCREWEGARAFLKVTYAPNENGPLDPNHANFKAEFQRFAKEITDRYEAEQKKNLDSKKSQNAVF